MKRTIGVLILIMILVEVVGYIIQRSTMVAPISSIMPDEVLNHTLRPNLNLIDYARDIPYTVYTNSQSWAEHSDVSQQKPPGVYRIFYVGDSNTHGVVEEHERLAEIVERELNAKGMRVEVVNTGTPSYSPILHYLLIKNKILALAPDLVIINVDMTDVRDDMLYRSLAEFDERGFPKDVHPSDEKQQQLYYLTPQGLVKIPLSQRMNAYAVKHSIIIRSLERVMLKIIGRKTPDPTAIPAPGDWLKLTWDEKTQDGAAYSMGILSETVHMLNLHGVRVMLTGVPHYPQYTGQWPRSRIRSLLKRLARSTCHTSIRMKH